MNNPACVPRLTVKVSYLLNIDMKMLVGNRDQETEFKEQMSLLKAFDNDSNRS